MSINLTKNLSENAKLIEMEIKQEKDAEGKAGYKTTDLRNFIRYYSSEFDQWWDRRLITDKQLMLAGVSEFLCTYCSYRFDVWFNKKLFNHDRYHFLAMYCSNKFDLWFDKNKLKKFIIDKDNKMAPTHNIIPFLKFCKNRFKDVYVSEMLCNDNVIKYLYEEHEDNKRIWLDFSTINFKAYQVSENLVQYCGKDIELWWNREEFTYSPIACLMFCNDFDHADHKKKFIEKFKLWWNPDKFNFSAIVKNNTALTSWNNMFGEYKNEWQKHIICEKLKE